MTSQNIFKKRRIKTKSGEPPGLISFNQNLRPLESFPLDLCKVVIIFLSKLKITERVSSHWVMLQGRFILAFGWVVLGHFMDILLLGTYARFSCSLIKWEKITIPIFPPNGWTTWPINEFNVSKLNWRQFFSCNNIHVYSTSIQLFHLQILNLQLYVKTGILL